MKLHLTVQTEFTTIAQIDQPGYIPNIGERVVIKQVFYLVTKKTTFFNDGVNVTQVIIDCEKV